jgi:hypothetical protein
MRGGATSLMQSDTVIDAAPTARPMRMRATIRVQKAGEKAASSTPTTSSTADRDGRAAPDPVAHPPCAEHAGHGAVQQRACDQFLLEGRQSVELDLEEQQGTGDEARVVTEERAAERDHPGPSRRRAAGCCGNLSTADPRNCPGSSRVGVRGGVATADGTPRLRPAGPCPDRLTGRGALSARSHPVHSGFSQPARPLGS